MIYGQKRARQFIGARGRSRVNGFVSDDGTLIISIKLNDFSVNIKLKLVHKQIHIGSFLL